MRRYILFVGFLISIIGLANFKVFALTPTPLSTNTKVQASIGKYYFSITGIASPFATIEMSSNDFFLASTVANNKGEFSISNVFVNEGFSQFCLKTIDVRRIGESYTCIDISPLTSDSRKDNIYLPPTLGLSGKTITIGSSVFASGYSMPGANISVNAGDGINFSATTDSTGYYKTEIKSLAVGKYLLIASANYQGRDSEKPLKGKELISLSIWQFILQNLPKILLLILLVLLIIILLIILISKRARRRIMNYLYGRGILTKKEDKKGLHHEWFIGF